MNVIQDEARYTIQDLVEMKIFKKITPKWHSYYAYIQRQRVNGNQLDLNPVGGKRPVNQIKGEDIKRFLANIK